MGYASAVAWVLFLVILVFTLLVFRSSSAWVHYEGGLRSTGPRR
jgi:multiple sugar transport system permease protein